MNNELIEQIARQHLGRSLSEAELSELRARWDSGQRAKEQAELIVASILALYEQRLSEQET